jgi:glutamyl-tRNA synthetase
LYHLANVVDDHDFEVTHVVRAVEHLSNTPRQVFILQSLGYEMPQYAHVPFVAEPGSKNKLSKRKIDQYLNNKEFKRLYQSGAEIARRIGVEADPYSFNPVLVDFYRDIGFLPDAVLNYLVLLGWSLDDKTENFSREEMLEHFSADRIVRSEASFDCQKLLSFQASYMNALPLKQKTKMCLGFLQKADLVSDPVACEQGDVISQIVEAAGDRICMAGDILKFDTFFIADEDMEFEDKPFQKRMVKPENAGFLLAEFNKVLNAADSFDAPSLEAELHGFCEAQGVGVGDIIHALRVAVTGKAAGFGMFDTLAILGRQRSCNRIQIALDELAKRVEANQ